MVGGIGVRWAAGQWGLGGRPTAVGERGVDEWTGVRIVGMRLT